MDHFSTESFPTPLCDACLIALTLYMSSAHRAQGIAFLVLYALHSRLVAATGMPLQRAMTGLGLPEVLMNIRLPQLMKVVLVRK
jgi:hypothetical protein